MKYIKNGTLDDSEFVGVIVYERASTMKLMKGGKESLGYEGSEITKAEYDLWTGRINNPDNETYFLGVFGNGVIDKSTHEQMAKKLAKKRVEQ